MISADALRRLAALNLPGDAYREVLAILADSNAHEDARRKKDRERKALGRFKEIPRKSAPRKRRAVPIPPNWFVSEAGREFARQKQQWDDFRIETEAERFRDYALAKGRLLIDWEAGWRQWVLSPFNAKAGNGAEKPLWQQQEEETYAVLRTIREYPTAKPRTNGPGGGGGADDTPAWLLPLHKTA